MTKAAKNSPRPEDIQRAPKLQRVLHTEDGREIPSNKPIAPPPGWFKAPSMVDQVRALVAGELSKRAGEQGYETAEEADDFEVGDDYDPRSPYEYSYELGPELHPKNDSSSSGAGEGSGGEGGPQAPSSPVTQTPTSATETGPGTTTPKT